MENGRMVQMILCVGLKGERLEFQIGVGDLGWGAGRGETDMLPGGEACGNWQGSLGRFPERGGGRKEEIGSR